LSDEELDNFYLTTLNFVQFSRNYQENETIRYFQTPALTKPGFIAKARSKPKDLSKNSGLLKLHPGYSINGSWQSVSPMSAERGLTMLLMAYGLRYGGLSSRDYIPFYPTLSFKYIVYKS
jgi:hypothetical protein